MPETILVVDDDRAVADMLVLALKKWGYKATAVGSVAGALKELKSRHTVAIVDIRLPDGDGVELIAEIKKSSPGTETLLLTGYASVDSAIRAIDEGVFAYITKPVDLEQLRRVIAGAIERHKLMADNSRLLAELQECNRLLELELQRTIAQSSIRK